MSSSFRSTTSKWRMSAHCGGASNCTSKSAADAGTVFQQSTDKGASRCLPAYEQVLKCSHLFNLLDARGAICVTERVGMIARVRELAVGVAEAWARTAAEGGRMRCRTFCWKSEPRRFRTG